LSQSVPQYPWEQQIQIIEIIVCCPTAKVILERIQEVIWMRFATYNLSQQILSETVRFSLSLCNLLDFIGIGIERQPQIRFQLFQELKNSYSAD
jgi:hypothetical protein